eukprot:3932997-Rhodomonas_salina.1
MPVEERACVSHPCGSNAGQMRVKCGRRARARSPTVFPGTPRPEVSASLGTKMQYWHPDQSTAVSTGIGTKILRPVLASVPSYA